MNAYLVPRPSLRGGVLWQRRERAVALTVSSTAFLLTLLLLTFVLMGVGYDPLLSLVSRTWRWLAVGALAVNVAAMTLVRIGPEGVRVRRLILAWLPAARAPLGGQFRRTFSDDLAEPDRDYEYDWDEDGIVVWIHYQYPGGSLSIDCLRPRAMTEWLNGQLRRVQERQVPVARVVDGRQGRE
jgi:hypothetical protein